MATHPFTADSARTDGRIKAILTIRLQSILKGFALHPHISGTRRPVQLMDEK